VRAGFAPPLGKEASHRLYTHTVAVARPHVSRFERNAALVRSLGGEAPCAPGPLALRPEHERDLAGLPARFVALHPGTSAATPYKRWPEARWAELACALRDQTSLPSVVTWGGDEMASARRVVELSGGAAQLAAATPRIGSLLALYARSHLFVGSDSGPLHLAALAGAPVVAIYGPTDPIENAPFEGVPSRSVRADVGCNPCREGCPLRTCMLAVGVEATLAAALELLEAASPPRDRDRASPTG
jgi:ADP-heptose:LPS heptosyltransferase